MGVFVMTSGVSRVGAEKFGKDLKHTFSSVYIC